MSVSHILTAPGAPFAVVRAENGSLVYAEGPRTLREFVEPAWAFGDQPFLVAEDRTYTYGEFFAAASALANRFLDTYGLRPGDRAVIAMRNHPEWQIAFWAAQLAGLIAVPLNAWWTEDEFRHALDDCAPRVLLVDGERLPRVSRWAAGQGQSQGQRDGERVRIVVFHHLDHLDHDGYDGYDGEIGPRTERYEELPAPDPAAAPPDVEVRPEDDATIIYTSGTTGRPKGAVATQLAQAGAAMNPRFQAAASALGRGRIPGQGPAPITLMTFPFFHVAAFTSLYSAMAVGGTLVLMRKWDARRALELIHEHRVTHFAGVPATALQLLEEATAANDPLESLTMLATGGAAAPPDLVARLTARYGERVEARNGYGLTETSGGVLANFGADYRRFPASVGRPTPVTELRIADPAGRPLPEGEVGELCLRGQSLVRGYWRDEAASARAFSRDGWFRTGDLAVVRDDGRVSVVDRVKDMIVRGGENVYCVEVEDVLHAHPDVIDAAVLGVPHPVLGEEVAAVVRIRPGAGTEAGELRAHVGRRLAAFKVPAHVLVQEEPLPRNPTGKILKRELRDPVAEHIRSGSGSGSGSGSASRTGSGSGSGSGSPSGSGSRSGHGPRPS
ncbi:class I adenylate-forming enzyme family protein [Streptomyces sp. 35G-GA-8]|uniref:class I adenylate-forming enzyme family protein n=1 Tax=Streptomyces sp. 35G-GA-8 TaxID=2939434 RepID=UPI00201ED58F|nr:class I adenylate-forming enzyme family protein [Streptomyces sp. 35G-GA-8]MCL7380095.1 acyl--CoA ligase [Streptomyces sp. 35G-GA-8]